MTQEAGATCGHPAGTTPACRRACVGVALGSAGLCGAVKLQGTALHFADLPTAMTTKGCN